MMKEKVWIPAYDVQGFGFGQAWQDSKKKAASKSGFSIDG